MLSNKNKKMKIFYVESILKIDLQVNRLPFKYKDLRDESPLRADTSQGP